MMHPVSEYQIRYLTPTSKYSQNLTLSSHSLIF